MNEPLTREELEALSERWPDPGSMSGPYAAEARKQHAAVATALHYLDRLAETERERDRHFDRAEAFVADLASSAVLSREDTEKLREALRVYVRPDEDWSAWNNLDGHAWTSLRAALALLDGRKEKQE